MIRTGVVFLAMAALSWILSPSSAFAQRGMGDPTGIAQRQVHPELVSLSGTLTSIETQPCEGGTGSGAVGTHLVIKTEKGVLLTVDLGWAKAVESIVKQLAIGKTVNASAFRTDKMPKDRYVAKSLTFDDKTVQLRDDNLRPYWAGRGPAWYGPGNTSVDSMRPAPGSGWGRRRSWARGYGRGWGRGSARGHGW